MFRQNALFLDRAYLHTVLHCIFAHLWIGGKREKYRYDIACDIAVEYTIDAMEKPCTKRILSWNRQKFYERLNRAGWSFGGYLYDMLDDMDTEKLKELAAEFYTDDIVTGQSRRRYAPGRR